MILTLKVKERIRVGVAILSIERVRVSTLLSQNLDHIPQTMITCIREITLLHCTVVLPEYEYELPIYSSFVTCLDKHNPGLEISCFPEKPPLPSNL
jgi:hypothetical protein